MHPDEVETLVCATRKPGSSFYEQLASEMRDLGVSPQESPLRASKPHLVADLESIVQEVVRVVEADFQDNERQNLPCQFEYHLIKASKPVKHIQVLTRLFKDGDPQSIFYGRAIASREDSKFALWVE